jgi:hypothetical protein
MAFWGAGERFRLFLGGLGSGKTRAGTVEMLRQPPDTTGAVICPTYRMLKDTIIPTIKEVAGELLVEFNKGDMYMVFAHGVKLLLRSSDDPDSLRGPNLSFFWMDEPALQTHMTWKIMLGRLRRDPGRAWCTGTPAGRNWLYKVFVKDADDDYAMFHATSYENPFLPDYYLNSLDKSYEGTFHKQEVHGEFVEWIDEPAYPGFRESRNCAEGLSESAYREWSPLNLCCDFNRRIMSWGVGQVVDGQPVLLNEITKEDAQVRDVCRAFRREYPSHRAGLWIYGDASGGAETATANSAFDQIQEEFESYPSDLVFMIPKKNPPPLDRLRALNDVLRGDGGVLFTMDKDRCPITQRDFEKCEMNKTGTNMLKIEDREDDRSYLTHASEGVGYWINMEFPVGSTRIPSPEEDKDPRDRKMMTPDRDVRRKRRDPKQGLLHGL